MILVEGGRWVQTNLENELIQLDIKMSLTAFLSSIHFDSSSSENQIDTVVNYTYCKLIFLVTFGEASQRNR